MTINQHVYVGIALARGTFGRPAIGWGGLLCALVGYALNSDTAYLTACGLLGADAYWRRAWPSLTLNAVWAVLALWRMLH